MFRAPITALITGLALSALAVVASGLGANPAAAAERPPQASSTAKAWQWVLSQRGSGIAVTSDAAMAAADDYPASWTGAVSGTFSPHSAAGTIVSPASIAVDSPADVGSSYLGAVSGHITLAPSTGRWIVQAYRVTPTGRVQYPAQALVTPSGAFSIDLGSSGSVPAGSWSLGLLDAQNSYAPAGVPWPAAPIYSGWEVRAFVTTDASYLVDAQPARADGTFSFPSSQPGTKSFELVDTGTGAVLAEAVPDFGLVRSYAGGSRTYTYDQALAVVTAVRLGSDAVDLTSGLMALQRPDGSFVDSADVLNPAAGIPVARTGVGSIATYALLLRLQSMPTADPHHGAVQGAAAAGVSWLLSQRRPDGLLGAGTGDYTAGGGVDAAAAPAWVSSEHNIDAWQTLNLAASVLSDGNAASAAGTLAAAIVSRLWNPATQRLRQGIAGDGSLDDTDPLDVSSWGALFLHDAGYPALAGQALAHTAAFASSSAAATGFRAYYPQPAFPAAPLGVWVEGSAGVSIARLQSGDATGAAAVTAQLALLQLADGSLPYSTISDTATSMSRTSSVAATTWYVLAALAPAGGAIWMG
jgi:hypothetical protein